MVGPKLPKVGPKLTEVVGSPPEVGSNTSSEKMAKLKKMVATPSQKKMKKLKKLVVPPSDIPSQVGSDGSSEEKLEELSSSISEETDLSLESCPLKVAPPAGHKAAQVFETESNCKLCCGGSKIRFITTEGTCHICLSFHCFFPL